MNNEVKKLHQTLHGYNCGHHLLASSIKLCDRSMRKMEKMSDLSGNSISKGFEQYYTGYYLNDEKCYVIACTWYAPEMNRPGCVWTHSLLINEVAMSGWKTQVHKLLDLFKRPQENSSYISYEKELIVNNTKEDNNIVKQERLKYIMWAIWGKSYPVIIPIDRANEYINEILFILFCQYKNLKKGFSFSTGSLSIRQYGKEMLDLQMVMKKNIRVAVGDNKYNILEENENIEQYPLWVDFLYDIIVKNEINDVLKFRNGFSKEFSDPKYFSMFIKMYMALDIQHERFNIIDGLQIIEALGDNKEALANSLLDVYMNVYFEFKINYVELMRFSLTRKWLNLRKEDYHFLVINSLKMQMVDSKKFVKDIAYIEESKEIEIILKLYSNEIPLKNFEAFTEKNIDICCLFVTLNPKFAKESWIWKQDNNFQQSVLQCLKGKAIDEKLVKTIIEQAITISDIDLCYDIYRVLGEKSLLYLLVEVCKHGIKYVQKHKSLKKVCNKNTSKSFGFLCEQIEKNKFEDGLLFVELFDPHSIILTLDQFKVIQGIFYNMRHNMLFEEYESKIARFYMILILKSEFKFSDEILSFSFTRVYSDLANQKFPQDEWEKMEYLMPEFGYHNWDRCKRLKKSLKKRGYTKREFESDEIDVSLI